MSLQERIDRFLADVFKPDCIVSTRDKLEGAIDLLKDASAELKECQRPPESHL